MSVIVKGMEMPGSCLECRFNIRGSCYASKILADIEVQGDTYQVTNWCPLAEVPTPHGRLIDADELLDGLKLLAKYEDEFRAGVICGVMSTIRSRPTIIEAEEKST